MSQRRTGGATLRPSGISRRIPVAAGLAVAALFVLVASAAAHEGGPRLILEPSEVSPGGVVLVRGEDLSLDEAMLVSLVGDTGRADLAAVTTDGVGHFTVAVEIPADAPVGAYAIEAVPASGATIRSLIRLAGSPILPDDGAPPGQDEGFPALQPLTSGAPVAAPVVPVASAGVTLRPLADPAGAGSEVDLVPFVALAGAIGALGFLAWRTRRPSPGTTRSADLP
jgi:hypothetical protein